MSDAINPDHYKRLPAEAIEIIESAIGKAPSNQDAYLHGQALKYLLRCWHKNGIEDLRKAKWYLDRLIESFDDSEPEQPKPTLNSGNIPEGYRKLKNSSIEPRQRGDLRWSIAERRYIEIGFEEIGYADRENWAACRKITGEGTGEGTGEVKPPDGWRWLEVGEILRRLDASFSSHGTLYELNTEIIGRTVTAPNIFVRRNRFEVGEKVVHVDDKELIPYEIDEYIYSKDAYVVKYKDGHYMYHWSKLAPYIEETT